MHVPAGETRGGDHYGPRPRERRGRGLPNCDHWASGDDPSGPRHILDPRQVRQRDDKRTRRRIIPDDGPDSARADCSSGRLPERSIESGRPLLPRPADAFVWMRQHHPMSLTLLHGTTGSCRLGLCHHSCFVRRKRSSHEAALVGLELVRSDREGGPCSDARSSVKPAASGLLRQRRRVDDRPIPSRTGGMSGPKRGSS